MNGEKKTYRFGVMLDSDDCLAWQRDELELLMESGLASPQLIVVNGSQKKGGRSGKIRRLVNALRNRRLFYQQYDKRVLRPRLEAFRRVDLPHALESVKRIQSVPTQEGKHSECFSEADVEAIRSENLDFLIRFGFGIIRGKIHETVRYGIWSFHHGDVFSHRGAPPCFWEIYHGKSVGCVTLQRLTDRMDAGVVLHRADYRLIPQSLTASKKLAFQASRGLMKRACLELAFGNKALFDAAPADTDAPVYQCPHRREFLAFLLKTAWRRVKYKAAWLFTRGQWGIGVIDCSVAELAGKNSCPPAEWAPQEKRHGFIADPMAIRWRDQTLIMAEELPDGQDNGRIIELELHDGKKPRRLKAIERGFHLSFPYLFEYEDRVYCIPESSEAKNLCAYELDESSGEWVEKAVLLEGREIFDATLFEHDGRWWMFYCVRVNACIMKLHACHASSPFGPWTEHPLNPLTSDIQSSRPAGPPFFHDGRLHRFGQNSNVRYGAAVTLCRIEELTPTSFVESRLQTVKPASDGDYAQGLHTIVPLDDHRTIIDGYRVFFSPLNPLKVVPASLRRWRERNRAKSNGRAQGLVSAKESS